MKNVQETDNNLDEISSFASKFLPKVMKGISCSQKIPSSNTPSHVYYDNFSGYRKFMNGAASKSLEMIQSLYEALGENINIDTLHNYSDIDKNMNKIINTNDKIIDLLNLEMDYIDNPKLKFEANKNYKALSIQSSQNESSATLLSAKNLIRPQTFFKEPVDNSQTPFRPHFGDAVVNLEIETKEYEHPFLEQVETLIDSLKDENELTNITSIEEYRHIENIEYQFIDKSDTLEKLIESLSKESYVAVDLEHHSFRSYFGITCLIQISTLDRDYIIDALALRHELNKLNKVFTDPKIMKILHGSCSDLLWLQRDFSVYIVNLFDTQVAAKSLLMPKKSLAFLLQHYTQTTTNKKFQLADWRIRPLTEEMIQYARIDTRYLIYIAKTMMKSLSDQGTLLSVLEKSNRMTLVKYYKPEFEVSNFRNIFGHAIRSFDVRKYFVAESLFAMRDSIARREDESVHFVLPINNYKSIVQNMPKEVASLLSVCNPCPPLVRKYAFDIQQLILDSFNKSEEELKSLLKTSWEEKYIEDEVTTISSDIKPVQINRYLFSPHDNSTSKTSQTIFARLIIEKSLIPVKKSKLSQIHSNKTSSATVNIYAHLIINLENFVQKQKSTQINCPYEAPSQFNKDNPSNLPESMYQNLMNAETDSVILLNESSGKRPKFDTDDNAQEDAQSSVSAQKSSVEEKNDDDVIILNDEKSSSGSISGKRARFARVKLNTKKKYQELSNEGLSLKPDNTNTKSGKNKTKEPNTSKRHSFGSIQKLFSSLN